MARWSSAVVVAFQCFYSLQNVELEERWVLFRGFVGSEGRGRENVFEKASIANGRVLYCQLGHDIQSKDARSSHKLIFVFQKCFTPGDEVVI